ncbi:Unknown protein [Striga hermonthica]|uniref:Uncharacterized protein n=1 Tax=Striga hermonthica TaxID=68872 RepID=A0A9N7MPA4_STRHE|nr:Unknown protein [Striga hermonthica]
MMALNLGAVSAQWRPCSRLKTLCLASPPATDNLRQQLDNLHKEADTTRAKANNARLRLMRLSEAVEKLRRQAAVSVQTGKEYDARELLFQKKKVTQAMEKLKSRIELLDELSAKLNEVISMKETLLIENMALDHDASETEATSPVRIVSPTKENSVTSDDDQHLDLNSLQCQEEEEEEELRIIPESESKNEESIVDKRRTGANNVYTYDDFMKGIDQQLDKIEQELETFLRYSNLLLGHKKKPEYSKVHHATEILAGIRRIRNRITTIRQTGDIQ